jgi:phosphoribosyl 1,2-cyclic phosphate phosphodiesterase
MRITFLGTGTSFGVPVVGCTCPVCTSNDPRNQRTRHGLLVESDHGRLLVDTPPELRLQLVAAGVTDIDAVYVTHQHADHVHGVDDLRIFTVEGNRRLPVYVPAEYEDDMRERFSYIWGPWASAAPGTTIPGLELIPFDDRQVISPAGFEITPIGFPHGPRRSYGFLTGGLAVIVDAKSVPEDAWPLLEGVEVLVLNALWFGSPHPTHFNVEEAVEVALSIGARRTYLTHLTHRLDHADLSDRLPDGIEPAWDGLTVDL